MPDTPPKIHLVAREGASRCPFCLDALDGGPACSSCGTRYHAECAALLGRCALLGCDGRPSAAAAGLRRAGLAVWLREEPRTEQLAAVRALLPGLSDYDARLRLRRRLPAVLGYLDEVAAARAVEALGAVAIPCCAVDPATLAAPAPPPVRRVTGAAPRLVAEVQGREPAVLDLTLPRIVVRGRYLDVDVRAPTHTGGTKPDPSRRTASVHRASRFAHVAASTEEPLVFEEGLLKDWTFLGDTKRATTTANWDQLLLLLAPGARQDASLEREEGWLMQTARSTTKDEKRSNRRWMDSQARLLQRLLALYG